MRSCRAPITGNANAIAHQISHIVRGSLAFDGRIGRQDQLTRCQRLDTLEQLIHTQLLGSDAIQGRQPAIENKIIATITTRLFYGEDICRRFDDTKQAFVAPLVAAQRADLLFCEITAPLTLSYANHGFLHDRSQRRACLTFAQQQVQGHALGTLGPYARQYLQGFDERINR